MDFGGKGSVEREAHVEGRPHCDALRPRGINAPASSGDIVFLIVEAPQEKG